MLQIHREDCFKILEKMKGNSIDAIVTDPPYGVSIMNSKWDKAMPEKKIWRECLRILKPGGHVIVFSSTRFYHHLAITMEDVGFEIQNMMAWLYGNGLPRGVDLSVQFDRNDNLPVPDDKFRDYLRGAIKKSPYTIKKLEDLCGTNGMFSHYLGRVQAQFPNYKNWKILKDVLNLDSTYDSLFEKLERRRKELQGRNNKRRKTGYFPSMTDNFDRHEPKSEAAKKWRGWRHGPLALRPCMESIYLGQKKPLRPITKNVTAFAVGALNIENCKVRGRDGNKRGPGNVLHDNSQCVVDALKNDTAVSSLNGLSQDKDIFHYVSKPNKKERVGNSHPTVKPIALMRHLVRLVVPKKGICLDPFMGSGTTGIACLQEGVNFIGVEREQEYFDIALERLKNFKR